MRLIDKIFHYLGVFVYVPTKYKHLYKNCNCSKYILKYFDIIHIYVY